MGAWWWGSRPSSQAGKDHRVGVGRRGVAYPAIEDAASQHFPFRCVCAGCSRSCPAMPHTQTTLSLLRSGRAPSMPRSTLHPIAPPRARFGAPRSPRRQAQTVRRGRGLRGLSAIWTCIRGTGVRALPRRTRRGGRAPESGLDRGGLRARHRRASARTRGVRASARRSREAASLIEGHPARPGRRSRANAAAVQTLACVEHPPQARRRTAGDESGRAASTQPDLTACDTPRARPRTSPAR